MDTHAELITDQLLVIKQLGQRASQAFRLKLKKPGSNQDVFCTSGSGGFILFTPSSLPWGSGFEVKS